jgi:bifunctional non-homologous end joining protein LigD
MNDEWTLERPLSERQTLLRQVIQPSASVQLVDNVQDGDALFALMKQHGMEGIIYKDINSVYTIGGKDKRWQKRKVIRDLVAVVGGVTYRGGRVNALMLGLYDEQGKLWYIGHAGTGKLTQKDWTAVTALAETLKVSGKSFVNKTEREKEAVWLRPSLTVKVNFAEWTPHLSLRQPSIQSFVDVPHEQCKFERE